MNQCAALALALALAGCANAGTAFEWKNAKQVAIGMTEAEVVGLMGKPTSVVTRGDLQMWSWVYVQGSIFGSKSQTVTFPLKDGRVSAVPNLAQFE